MVALDVDLFRPLGRWSHYRSIAERIVVMSDDCWVWTGTTLRGYGTVNVDGKTYRAHRLIWESLVGEIPPDRELDHLCLGLFMCHFQQRLPPVLRRYH